MSALFCSRCGARITAAYEPGTCFAVDCEPAKSDSHDDSQTMSETFGDDPEAFAELFAWSDRDHDRFFAVTRLPVLDADGESIGGRWTVRLESNDLSWSNEEDGYDELSRAVRVALKAAADAGFP